MNKDKALKLALEALETELAVDMTNGAEVGEAAEKMCEAITAIKEALAQPKQEPVALMIYHDHICYKSQADDQSFGFWCPVNQDLPFPDLPFPEGTKFYTTPPQRTWVELTDEEIEELANEYLFAEEDLEMLFVGGSVEFARALLKKAREK